MTAPILVTAVRFLPDRLELVSSNELAESWLESETSRCFRPRFFPPVAGICSASTRKGTLTKFIYYDTTLFYVGLKIEKCLFINLINLRNNGVK